MRVARDILNMIGGEGGGGGGNVSGVKGDAEETYRTGNVNITAANVGAYTKTETNTLLNGKADTTDVDNVKISNTATGTSITLTDSAGGYVQSVTVKGNSEVVSGEIASVGDDGLTITSTDGMTSTTATITTGLPLRSVGSVYDTMNNNLIVKRCAEIDLGDLSWSRGETTTPGVYNFYTYDLSPLCLSNNNTGNGICADYAVTTIANIYNGNASDKSVAVSGNTIRIRDDSYTDATAFKTALAGIKLIYILATRTTLSLSSAEKAALMSLRTYSGTTNISATDSPLLVVDYFKNSDNGKAVANVDNKCLLKHVTWTGTGTATNTITFPEVPTYILGIVCNETITTDSITWPFPYGVPCCFCVYGIRSNYNDSHIFHANLTYSADELSLTLTGADPGAAQNINGYSYTIYYI